MRSGRTILDVGVYTILGASIAGTVTTGLLVVWSRQKNILDNKYILTTFNPAQTAPPGAYPDQRKN